MNWSNHTAGKIMLGQLQSGLAGEQKTLPSKYFYDEHGSRLFERITRQPEYYLARAEMRILQLNMPDIVALLGAEALLIEYGSGASLKTRLLLDHLPLLAGYVPIDISGEHLLASVEALRGEFPSLRVLPVVADYTDAFMIPDFDFFHERRIVFFPGDAISDFSPREARRFLARMAQVSGTLGGVLIGVDLKKDAVTHESAYNDARGVTAEFNRNMLARMNREYGSNFDPEAFAHRAVFNAELSRMEMHLVSTKQQQVELGGRTYEFRKDESILTQCSYKYALEEFAKLVSEHFTVEHVWTDARQLFSVQYLAAHDLL